MFQFERFSKDRSGSLRETTAVAAFLIAMFGVSAALGLDHLTQEGALPRIALIPAGTNFVDRLNAVKPLAGQTSVASVPVDDFPVGSIPGGSSRPIILDPCTGEQK